MNQGERVWAGLTGDTIAALATPAGAGGIGIVRISGQRAWEVGLKLFRPRRGGCLTAGEIPERQLLLGELLDPENGRVIDEVLCAFFRGPRSYTTEDVVEIQGHGGPAVTRRALEACLAQGCRLARPGEFTLRAFLGGRLDLAQAEAVAELVGARSQTEAGLALAGLKGGLGQRLAPVRAAILRAAAALEAAIDFPEEMEALAGPALAGELEAAALGPLRVLLAERRQRRLFREGARVVLCGRPNVGKSSLFNAILGCGRALVSALAGTTRDYLEEAVVLGGVATRLVDTAGLGLGQGGGEAEEVERLGQESARELARAAELRLVVLDGASGLNGQDMRVLHETQGLPRLVAVNKADLGAAWDLAELGAVGIGASEALRVSARDGAGLEGLCLALGKMLCGGQPEPQAGEVVASARQAEALGRAIMALDAAAAALVSADLAVELASVELGEALAALGEVDGQGAPDELIEAVFSQFCLGK